MSTEVTATVENVPEATRPTLYIPIFRNKRGEWRTWSYAALTREAAMQGFRDRRDGIRIIVTVPGEGGGG